MLNAVGLRVDELSETVAVKDGGDKNAARNHE